MDVGLGSGLSVGSGLSSGSSSTLGLGVGRGVAVGLGVMLGLGVGSTEGSGVGRGSIFSNISLISPFISARLTLCAQAQRENVIARIIRMSTVFLFIGAPWGLIFYV